MIVSELAAPYGSEVALPSDFYISPTPEDLALRALGAGFHVEARQLGISSEQLLAMLIRALPNNGGQP